MSFVVSNIVDISALRIYVGVENWTAQWDKDDSFLWFLALIYTTKFILVFEQDAPYPMNLSKLGHAVIVNNVAKEMPGSMNDVKALEAAFRMVGFQVEAHTNMSKVVCDFSYISSAFTENFVGDKQRMKSFFFPKLWENNFCQ